MPKPRILNSWPFSRRRAGLALESLEPRQMLASYAVNFNRIYANGGLGAAFSVTGTLGPGAANQANWNNIAAPQSVNSPFGGNFNATITDNSGQNGLTLHTVFANHEGGNDGGGVPTNDFESLYFTGMRLGDLSIHITTDVAPYRTYDLYIYNQHGDSFSVNNAGAINVSGRTSGPLGNDFVLNRNYTIVPGLTGPLDLWAYDAIQGFSIVAPPPETIQVTEAIVNPGASAIDILLNREANASSLNLYDGPDAPLDPADVVLIGPDGRPVAGSLVWDSTPLTYWYWVKSSNVDGASDFSVPNSGYQGTLPPAPSPTPLGAPLGGPLFDFPSAAPPVNDNFADQTVIAPNQQTVTGTNVDATKEVGEPSHIPEDPGGKSVWWSWTAPSAGNVQIDTAGSNFDTVLAVYTGTSVGSLTHIAHDDDTIAPRSRVNFDVVPGTTYQIAVDGFAAAAGNIQLNVTLTSSDPPLAPLNVTATDGSFTDKVRVSWSPAANATAYEVYRNTLDDSGAATKISALDVVGSTFDDTTAVPGTTYFYWVKAKNNNGTSGFSAADTGVRAILRPANDDFANRIALSGAAVNTSGTNVNGTKEPGEPDHAGNAGGRSIWWTWTAPSAGNVVIDTVGATLDTLLAVYTGAGVNALTPVASDDDGGGGGASRVSFRVTNGAVYQIAVDGKDGVFGTATLRLAFTPVTLPPAPTNVTATDGAFPDRIRVTWNSVPNATSYEVWRATTDNTGDAAKIADVTGTSFDDLTATGTTTRRLAFVPTGGPLSPGHYTLRLASRADGFASLDPQVGILDGDKDGTAGGDFVMSFDVSASSARVLGVPDFARGPRQSVQLAGAGLPVRIDNAAGLTQIDFTLDYNPALLRIDAANPAAGLPVGWRVDSLTIDPAGHARVQASGPALTGGPTTLVTLDAGIPADAILGRAGAVRLSAVRLNGGALASLGDVAVQSIAYPGDVNGSGSFSGLDASLIARVSVDLDSGFDAFAAISPKLAGDVTGNGRLTGLDASFVARKAIGLDQPEIPDLPPSPAPEIAFSADENRIWAGDLISDINALGADDESCGDIRVVDFTAEDAIDPAGVENGRFLVRDGLSADADLLANLISAPDDANTDGQPDESAEAVHETVWDSLDLSSIRFVWP